MGGKSTFLRQNALLAMMAQAGFFVPADSARIGVVDHLFCRVRTFVIYFAFPVHAD